MPRTISIGCQDFETIRKEAYFYIDKTQFIKEWWEQGDSVTLITRPRRFGKTLTMNMVEKFRDTDEKELSDTVKKALEQIEKQNYESIFVSKGIPKERIRKYGFAFCGKKVLIGSQECK